MEFSLRQSTIGKIDTAPKIVRKALKVKGPMVSLLTRWATNAAPHIKAVRSKIRRYFMLCYRLPITYLLQNYYTTL